MKNLAFTALILTFILGACSPMQIASSDGEPATPVLVTEYPTVEEPASVSPDHAPTSGYQPVKVVDVNVEVGQGSPLPVFVDVGADLPDVCAQVEYVNIVQDGDTFKIQVGTVPSTTQDCLRDTVPFRMKIPLNVNDLPVGSYAAEVNGIRAEFEITASASTATDLRNAQTPIVKRDVLVDSVSVEVGRGSPLPVHTVVSANLPNGCSQLTEIQMHRDGNTFYVRLVSSMPAETECNPDTPPLRVEVPLNIIPLTEGTYEVIVNSATTSFDIPIQ